MCDVSHWKFSGQGWGRVTSKYPAGQGERRGGSAWFLARAHVTCIPGLFSPFPQNPPAQRSVQRLACFGMPVASLCEPPRCVGDNITKLLWWPSPILPHLCSLLYIFQGPPFPSKSTLLSPPFYLVSLSQRPFRPSPTLLSISLPSSCSHATLSSLFPFTLLCFPFHSISLPHPEGLRGLHLSALHPSFHPFPSTDLGQALRTPCAAQGYRRGHPLQRRNTGRGTRAATPPLLGLGEGSTSCYWGGAAVCEWTVRRRPWIRAARTQSTQNQNVGFRSAL